MAARYILGTLAIVFLILGLARAVREGRLGSAARTWLVIGLMFGAVSLWLAFTAAR